MNRDLFSFYLQSFALVLASYCGVLVSQAQTQPQVPTRETSTLQVTTRLVILDVVVTNAKGEVIPGLKKEDFTLLQDGTVQPIRHFDGWDYGSTPTAAPDTSGRFDVTTSPLTIFVIDDLNTPFDEQSYAAFTLKRYLEAQPLMLGTPAMLMVVNDRGLATLVDYTRNRNALLQGLANRPAGYPAQLESSQNLELLSESFAILRQIALAAEGLHGHKTMVWVGRGFPTVANADLDQRGNDALQAAMRETVTMLTRDRITLYKVDPITTNARMAATDLATTLDMGSGMGTTANILPADEDPLKGDFNFNQFASQTGGAYLYGRNDLDKFLGESLDRGSHFYTLAYVPAAAARPESFQSIKIKMRDPSLVAVTRSGFFDESTPRAEPSAKNIGYDLKLAANGSIIYNGVAVHIAAVTLSAATKRVTVHYMIQDRSLSWSPQESGTETTKILTVIAALDAEHNVQISSAAVLGLAAKDSQETARGTISTTAEVSINDKSKFVRLLVRDSSGRIGSADIPVSTLTTH